MIKLTKKSGPLDLEFGPMPKYIIFFMIVPWLPLTLVSVSVAGARH
jgi:hypothetical protein